MSDKENTSLEIDSMKDGFSGWEEAAYHLDIQKQNEEDPRIFYYTQPATGICAICRIEKEGVVYVFNGLHSKSYNALLHSNCLDGYPCNKEFMDPCCEFVPANAVFPLMFRNTALMNQRLGGATSDLFAHAIVRVYEEYCNYDVDKLIHCLRNMLSELHLYKLAYPSFFNEFNY